MKIPIKTFYDASIFGDQLFNIKEDEYQKYNLVGKVDTQIYDNKLKELLKQYQAPEEEFQRLGLLN